MWIAQLSDPHLRPEGVLYKNVLDSNAAFLNAVRQVNDLVPQPDLVLLTGDIVDEGRADEYAVARDILAILKAPLRVIQGNHDDPVAFRAAFRDHGYLPATAPLHFLDANAGPVRVIALDVTVSGEHHGTVDPASLDWLAAVLAVEPDRPTVVMMHQPPLRCGVPYLDAYRCRNEDALERLISRHPNVERILCGHVHRMMQMRFGGTLLCTAPSTATAIALHPFENACPASFIEPAGFLLHHWQPHAMITHFVPIGVFPGPFPFA